MLDLKHLLIEAKQKVPTFLALMQSENEPIPLGGSSEGKRGGREWG